MIGLIDYGAGNLRSVHKALRFLGAEVKLASRADDLQDCEAIVLPGVGAFDDCAQALERQGLKAALQEHIQQGTWFLGICVGYQILFDASEEFDSHAAGLGVIPGKVVRFPQDAGIKIPQIGWNQVAYAQPDCPLFDGIPNHSYFYFVHSFYPQPKDQSVVVGMTEYGNSFASAVWRDRLFATQFHPEKSQQVGLRLLENFCRIAGVKTDNG